MRWFVLGLLLTVSGCYTHAGSTEWHPASAASPTNQIVDEAVEIGPADVAKIEAAGGMATGVIDVDDDAYPTKDAAYFGGTHCMIVREEHAVTSHGTWSQSHSFQRWRVFRVPRGSWHRLPAALRPKA